MTSKIYNFSLKHLKAFADDINTYIFNKRSIFPNETSYLDFQRENFIAGLFTQGCTEEEIVQKIFNYTGNSTVLTSTILSAAGGQSLFSTCAGILDKLELVDCDSLKGFFKTGYFRQLIYTKNDENEHFVNLFMSFYGFRDGVKNFVLNLSDKKLKQVKASSYETVFNSSIRFDDKKQLEFLASKEFHFEIAPFACVYLRFKMNELDDLVPLVGKLAINYYPLQPRLFRKLKIQEEMPLSGCLVFHEFQTSLHQDLMKFKLGSDESHDVIQLATKLNLVFSLLKRKLFNQFLIGLLNYHFLAKEYLEFQVTNLPVKFETQEELLEYICNKINFSLDDLDCLNKLFLVFEAEEIKKLTPIGEILIHFASTLNLIMIKNYATSGRSAFSDGFRIKIKDIPMFNKHYILSEYKKMETLFLIKAKTFSLLSSYNVPTLNFEGVFDEIEDEFLNQLKLNLKLNLTIGGGWGELRLILLHRLKEIEYSLEKIKKTDDPNITRKQLILDYLASLRGYIQSYAYLFNHYYIEKKTQLLLDNLFDNQWVGLKNPHVKQSNLTSLFSVKKGKEFNFHQQVVVVWLGYLISIECLFDNAPKSLNSKILSSLKKDIQFIKNYILDNPVVLSKMSLVQLKLNDTFSSFYEQCHSELIIYFLPAVKSWLIQLEQAIINSKIHLHVIHSFCLFFEGEIDREGLVAELEKLIQPPKKTKKEYSFFQRATNYVEKLSYLISHLKEEIEEEQELSFVYSESTDQALVPIV